MYVCIYIYIYLFRLWRIKTVSKLRLKHHLVSIILQGLTQNLCPWRGENMLANPWTQVWATRKTCSSGIWRERMWAHRDPDSGCSLSQWSIIHLTNWRLGQIYEFSKLNQNEAWSDLQKVTQLYWIFVSILWPKIKWVTIQDRFRNLPVDFWQLWVSVWGQRAYCGFSFPDHRLSAQGPEVPAQKPVSCHQHSIAHRTRSRFGRKPLAPPQHIGSHWSSQKWGHRSTETRKWTHPLATKTSVTWVVARTTNLACLSSLSPFPAQPFLHKLLFHLNRVFINIPLMCP